MFSASFGIFRNVVEFLAIMLVLIYILGRFSPCCFFTLPNIFSVLFLLKCPYTSHTGASRMSNSEGIELFLGWQVSAPLPGRCVTVLVCEPVCLCVCIHVCVCVCSALPPCLPGKMLSAALLPTLVIPWVVGVLGPAAWVRLLQWRAAVLSFLLLNC